MEFDGVRIFVCASNLTPDLRREMISAFRSLPASLLRELSRDGMIRTTAYDSYPFESDLPHFKKVQTQIPNKSASVGGGPDRLHFSIDSPHRSLKKLEGLLDGFRRGWEDRKAAEALARRRPRPLLFNPHDKTVSLPSLRRFLSYGMEVQLPAQGAANLSISHSVDEAANSSNELRLRLNNRRLDSHASRLISSGVYGLYHFHTILYAGLFGRASTDPLSIGVNAAAGTDIQFADLWGHKISVDSNLQFGLTPFAVIVAEESPHIDFTRGFLQGLSVGLTLYAALAPVQEIRTLLNVAIPLRLL